MKGKFPNNMSGKEVLYKVLTVLAFVCVLWGYMLRSQKDPRAWFVLIPGIILTAVVSVYNYKENKKKQAEEEEAARKEQEWKPPY